jgi:pimeloyl-ACP methyl ester carboxylesterase
MAGGRPGDRALSASSFTPSHRGGRGAPLVLIHGFMDTWRIWELVLPALQRDHDVLALTLAGHAGGPPFPGPATEAGLLDALEQAMDDAGWTLAHLAGNSLGGYLALKLAERGRARTVTALAPAGGWAQGDTSYRGLLSLQLDIQRSVATIAPQAEAFLATPSGRRAATQYTAIHFLHIPVALLAHQMRGLAACAAAPALVAQALSTGWSLDPARIACPVRLVWGTGDRLLPWPSAAERFRSEWLPHADWIILDDVGHCPQLDVPAEAAELIAGFA